jgi:hypothetical protein
MSGTLNTRVDPPLPLLVRGCYRFGFHHRSGGGGVHGDRRSGGEQVLNWSGLPLTSRLTIGLWAIRKGRVKSTVQSKSGLPVYRTPYRGCHAMKSKLLQKKS